MKAFVVQKYAHPSQIPLTVEAPEPKAYAAKNEVLVDVYSAGMNFFDVGIFYLDCNGVMFCLSTLQQILQAQGKYQNLPPFPFVRAGIAVVRNIRNELTINDRSLVQSYQDG